MLCQNHRIIYVYLYYLITDSKCFETYSHQFERCIGFFACMYLYLCVAINSDNSWSMNYLGLYIYFHNGLSYLMFYRYLNFTQYMHAYCIYVQCIQMRICWWFALSNIILNEDENGCDMIAVHSILAKIPASIGVAFDGLHQRKKLNRSFTCNEKKENKIS